MGSRELHSDHAWREIRDTDSEKVLVAAEEAGGWLTHKQAADVVGDEWQSNLATARLRELGLTSPDEDYDEFRLSEDGRRLARHVIESRLNGPERWDAVQKAMLRFVAEQQPDRAYDVVGTEADGQQVTDGEAEHAFEFLKSNGLLDSISLAEAPDVRPTITSRGRYALHEPNIRDYVERGFVRQTNYDYSTNTTVSGGTLGAVTGGTGNTVNVVQQISHDERSQTLAHIERVLSGLSDTTEDAPLRTKVEEIKAEAESPDASKPRILAKARDALVLASATEGGRSVIEWIGKIITGLGG